MLCGVLLIMCICVSLVSIPETPLSVLFCVCKVCATFLDLCLGVPLLSSGQCHCSVCVSCLCVPTDKLSVFVLKSLHINVVMTLLFDIVHFLVLL